MYDHNIKLPKVKWMYVPDVNGSKKQAYYCEISDFRSGCVEAFALWGVDMA
jgi:hypothetical protein